MFHAEAPKPIKAAPPAISAPVTVASQPDMAEILTAHLQELAGWQTRPPEVLTLIGPELALDRVCNSPASLHPR